MQPWSSVNNTNCSIYFWHEVLLSTVPGKQLKILLWCILLLLGNNFFWSCPGKSKVCVISCQNTTKQKSQMLVLQLQGLCSFLSHVKITHSIFILLLHTTKRIVISLSGSNGCFVVYLTRYTSTQKYLFLCVFKMHLLAVKLTNTHYTVTRLH